MKEKKNSCLSQATTPQESSPKIVKLSDVFTTIKTLIQTHQGNLHLTRDLKSLCDDLALFQDQEQKLIRSLKNDKLLTIANYDNMQKRLLQEQAKSRKYRNYEIFHKLLLVLDNMESALNVKNVSPDVKNFLIGFEMIYKNIIKIMTDDNVKLIKTDVGDVFDHNYHHVIDTEEKDQQFENQITKVLQKGYLLHDMVLRPASVVVAKSVPHQTKEHEQRGHTPGAPGTPGTNQNNPSNQTVN